MDFQSTLLDYFIQQSVAHGAMLFSAVIATFYFFNSISKEKMQQKIRSSWWRELGVVAFSGVLVSACIYVLARIVVYGMLSQSTLGNAPLQCINQKYEIQYLSDYYECVRTEIPKNWGQFWWSFFQIFTLSAPYYTKWFVGFAFGLLLNCLLLGTLDLIDFDVRVRVRSRDWRIIRWIPPFFGLTILMAHGIFLIAYGLCIEGLMLLYLGIGISVATVLINLRQKKGSEKVAKVPEEEKRIIRKDDDVQINLFFGDHPYALGHTVVQPENCEDDISKLTGKHWEILSKWIPRVAIAMKKVLKEVSGREVKRIYLCSFNESADYPVHFHLVPRYECETLRGDGLLFHRSQSKLMISHQERDKIVNAMKKELESTCVLG